MKRLLILVMVAVFAIAGAFSLTRSSAAHAIGTGSVNVTTPTRLYDSRTDDNKRPLQDGKVFAVHVLGGSGIPLSGVSAVMLNIHALPIGTKGKLSAYASDGKRPNDGQVYFGAHDTASNEVLVPVGPDGSINLVANAPVNVVIEAQGWVGIDGAAAANKLTTFDAYTVLSTRDDIGPRHKPFAKNTSVNVKVAGVGPVPSNARAVILNLVSYDATDKGNVYVQPAGTTTGRYSMMAVSANRNVANQVIVPVGDNGSIQVSSTAGQTDLAIAVEGYYSAGSTVAPQVKQVLNTVNAKTPLSKNEVRKLQIAGANGIPANAASVSLHFTAVTPNSDGQVSIMPFGSVVADYDQSRGIQPPAQALLYPPNTTISNTVSLPLGPNGAVAIKSSEGNFNIVVDVVGWTLEPTYSVSTPTAAVANCAASTPTAVPQDTQQATQILRNTNKYAMGTWWNGAAVKLLNDPLDTDSSRGAADPVRRLAMEAFSMATSLSTCTFDSTTAGVSKDVATQRTAQLISYIASHHVSNKVDGWGGGWQGSLWTAYAGRAAWLIWGSLPTNTQTNVARMVHFEADDAMGKHTNYLRAANGTFLNSPGDTGAEDTAWRAMPIQLATVMFPTDPQWAVWKYTVTQAALAAWARPDDTSNQTVINGQSIGNWIHGSNVEENGIVYNHQRVAPDYMSNMYQTMDDIWVQALAGNAAPLADRALIAPVYDAYTGVLFDDGTIYVPNSSTIYYPQGIDWGTGQELPYALADVQTATFGAATDTAQAKKYEQLHLQAEVNMQNRFTDGRTYANDTEYNYVGREEHTAQLAAQFFLTTLVRDNNLITFTNQDYRVQPSN